MRNRARSCDNRAMRTVAVIGASADPSKFGNKAVRAYQRQGYQVFPVNPKVTELAGVPAYASLSAVPVRPDLVSVYLPPAVVLKVLPEIAAKGCDELWLNPGTGVPRSAWPKPNGSGLNVVQACSIVGLGLSPSEARLRTSRPASNRLPFGSSVLSLRASLIDSLRPGTRPTEGTRKTRSDRKELE